MRPFLPHPSGPASGKRLPADSNRLPAGRGRLLAGGGRPPAAKPALACSLILAAVLAPLPWALLTPLSAAGQVSGGEPEARELSQLRTAAERSGFTRHTLHEEMLEYLAQVSVHAEDLKLGSYGRTLEGRDLPYLLFSRPRVGSPAEAHASGKPVLVLGANAHGHNYVVRESLLILLRELGDPEAALNRLLDEIIVLVVPSKNPDGLAAESRFNARGADLNRDYMALDQPAMAAYVGAIVNEWEPHLFVDGHDGGAVQYGGARPYHLLRQGPGLAGADPTLTALADERIFPFLDGLLEEQGFRAFYWSRGDTERWYVGGSVPRMGRNYGGLANKVSILFEVAEWPGMKTGVAVGTLASRAILRWAAEHGDELVGTVRAARERTREAGRRAEGRIPVAERMEAAETRVTFQVAHPERDGELLTVEDAEILMQPVGTRFRDRPYAYLLPPAATEAVALLRRHNIQVERLTRPVEREVLRYTLSGVEWEASDNHHRAAPRIQVGEEVKERLTLPAGSWMIRTGQSLGRVAAHLLEPETTDNVFYWDRMTFLLPLPELEAHRLDPAAHEAPFLPILKLMDPGPLPLAVHR